MPNPAISLYRSILRAAKLLPTDHRRTHVFRKARSEFEKSKQVTDDKQLTFLLKLAETQLDNIEAQAKHLQELVATGKLRW